MLLLSCTPYFEIELKCHRPICIRSPLDYCLQFAMRLCAAEIEQDNTITSAIVRDASAVEGVGRSEGHRLRIQSALVARRLNIFTQTAHACSLI